RELFQQKRVLMVWDNFESVLEKFQQDGAAGSALELYPPDVRSAILRLFRDWTDPDDGQGRLLVTCRPEEAGLVTARRMELHGLARPDSLWLLTRVAEI